jgi:hypothetical protein
MESAPKSTTLAPFIETLKVGDGMGHLNLTLVPLRGEGHGHLDYTLAADAIAAGVLTVTEVSEGGSVPQLAVVNEATKMVLFLDGEELVGAKQNRILNTSVLVAPKSQTKIPVSCVEQGRWRYAAPDFRAGGYSPSKLRARKSRDVTHNLMAEGRAVSDQGAVWEEVAANHASLGSHSPTMAMHDAIEQRRELLDGYLKALPYPQGARGVWVSISGGFAAMDLFDRSETLERVWPRLMTGYALDALAARNRKDPPLVPRGALVILERLGHVACQPCPSVGVGEDWRFEAEDLVGQALVAEGVCVHLSAFPNEARDGRGPGRTEQQIVPPSRRRRNRRGPPDDIV